ncbi:MAG: RidA family protein, partial [Acetobacteraceae bacterium]|nr:RidA family protein [Acetobacteraceae bacterium]
MSKINRQGSNQILSSSVEYHNFVFLAGLTADDLAKDIKGQTAEVLAKIDAALEANGTDKTRM